MKVIIENATGSVKEEAMLDKDSGVIEFKSGEISHVLFEKQFNKRIFVVKEVKKEEVVTPSTEQSEARPESKIKRKSK